MIYTTPHPHAAKLDAIERAVRRVSNWRRNYQQQASDPLRKEDVNRLSFAKSTFMLRRMEQQHFELLNSVI